MIFAISFKNVEFLRRFFIFVAKFYWKWIFNLMTMGKH